MRKLDHIGIAVSNLEKSEALFTLLFGQPPYKKEQVDSESVITSFFRCGTSKIELLQDLGGKGVIAKFIQNRGEGIHHLAFDVDDIHLEMQRLKNAGFTLMSEHPTNGADNKLVCFLHPKSTNGILVELCQEIKP